MQKIKPKCPHCGGEAQFWRVTKDSPQRIWCPSCLKPFDHVAAPKVLVYDIETSQMNVKTFRTGEQRIRGDQIQEDWYVLSWTAKWLFKKDTFGSIVNPSEAKRRNDKRVVREFHNVLKQADFVITYNGDRFDIKRMNWRFMVHKMRPVQHYKSIDLFREIKKVADPSSLSLDFIAKQLGYGGKLETNKGLWDDCEAGKKEALDYMYTYNSMDIWKTEDVYAHVRPYMQNHPSFAAWMNMYQDLGKSEHRCPRCVSGIISEEKFELKYITPAGYMYKIASCPKCGCMVRKTGRRGIRQDARVR